MIGRAAVTLVLVYNSEYGESWGAAERLATMDTTRQALRWWETRAKERGIPLEFVVNNAPGGGPFVVDTRFRAGSEPNIANHYNWQANVLGTLGAQPATAAQFPTVDGAIRLGDNFNYQVRQRLRTDWAFTIFIPFRRDGYAPWFQDTRNGRSNPSGVAYREGPFLWMPAPASANTLAHEIGHIFGAADQYNALTPDQCAAQWGYLQVTNQNAIGCASNQESIMKWAHSAYLSGSVDPYAAGQIGWRDSNSNGVHDAVETPAAITAKCQFVGTNGLRLSAYANQVSFWEQQRSLDGGVTIGKIRTMQVQDPYGGWWAPRPISYPSGSNATTADDTYNTYQEASTYVFQQWGAIDPNRVMRFGVRTVERFCAQSTAYFDILPGRDCVNGTVTLRPVQSSTTTGCWFDPNRDPSCYGAVATILGTESNDTLYDSDGPDVIVTFGGNDKVYTRGHDRGRDLVCTGDGDDSVYIGGSVSTITFVAGEGGNDFLVGGDGYDLLNGGTENDTLYGFGSSDNLLGEMGNDRLFGGAGNDSLHGGSGDDLIEGGDGIDYIYDPLGVNRITQ